MCMCPLWMLSQVLKENMAKQSLLQTQALRSTFLGSDSSKIQNLPELPTPFDILLVVCPLKIVNSSSSKKRNESPRLSCDPHEVTLCFEEFPSNSSRSFRMNLEEESTGCVSSGLIKASPTLLFAVTQTSKKTCAGSLYSPN